MYKVKRAGQMATASPDGGCFKPSCSLYDNCTPGISEVEEEGVGGVGCVRGGGGGAGYVRGL